MRLDCVGDETILGFAEKIVGLTALFMHFLVLFMGLLYYFN